MSKSKIIYSGPSLIDGRPIVCIAVFDSKNAKTGPMVQTYIIRADISPLEASKSGQDYSICGTCIHRGKPTDNPSKKQATERSCYVNLGQGPTIVYKAFKRGAYGVASDDDIRSMAAGYTVRLGTYGDPAAVPRSIWDALLSGTTEGHTGYSHNIKFQPSIVDLCMVSADSKNHAIGSIAHNRRTFRVIPVIEWQKKEKKALLKNEILCPASAEMNYKSTCDKCKLCSGNTIKAKSVAIVAHGASKNYIR